MEPIAFTSRLQRRDLFRLGVRLSILNTLALTAMAAGPVLWLVGTLAGGTVVRAFGATLLILVPGVPLAALLAASYNAYRPTATEFFVPVDWEFGEGGVRIRQGDSDAFAEWQEFFGWRRVGAFFLLHTSRGHYIVLPAAAVPPARMEEFGALLAENVRSLR